MECCKNDTQESIHNGVLVLAAGESRRMGTPKALLDLGGIRLLERHIATFRQEGYAIIGVVLGHQLELLRQTADLSGARVIEHPGYAAGQLSSIRQGVEALRSEGCNTVLLTPVDCPPVSPEVRAGLHAALASRPGLAAIVPGFQGAPGHPVLLGRAALEAVAQAAPDTTLEKVLQGLGARVLLADFDDPDVLWNLNRPDDVARYLAAHPALEPHNPSTDT